MPYRKEDDHDCLPRCKNQEPRIKTKEEEEVRIHKFNPGRAKINRLADKNRRGYFSWLLTLLILLLIARYINLFVMIILIFFIAHWFLSLFFQTFFQHRYASHHMFTTSKAWERIFYIMAYICEGASFLNPRAYAIMHREHH